MNGVNLSHAIIDLKERISWGGKDGVNYSAVLCDLGISIQLGLYVGQHYLSKQGYIFTDSDSLIEIGSWDIESDSFGCLQCFIPREEQLAMYGMESVGEIPVLDTGVEEVLSTIHKSGSKGCLISDIDCANPAQVHTSVDKLSGMGLIEKRGIMTTNFSNEKTRINALETANQSRVLGKSTIIHSKLYVKSYDPSGEGVKFIMGANNLDIVIDAICSELNKRNVTMMAMSDLAHYLGFSSKELNAVRIALSVQNNSQQECTLLVFESRCRSTLPDGSLGMPRLQYCIGRADAHTTKEKSRGTNEVLERFQCIRNFSIHQSVDVHINESGGMSASDLRHITSASIKTSGRIFDEFAKHLKYDVAKIQEGKTVKLQLTRATAVASSSSSSAVTDQQVLLSRIVLSILQEHGGVTPSNTIYLQTLARHKRLDIPHTLHRRTVERHLARMEMEDNVIVRETLSREDIISILSKHPQATAAALNTTQSPLEIVMLVNMPAESKPEKVQNLVCNLVTGSQTSYTSCKEQNNTTVRNPFATIFDTKNGTCDNSDDDDDDDEYIEPESDKQKRRTPRGEGDQPATERSKRINRMKSMEDATFFELLGEEKGRIQEILSLSEEQDGGPPGLPNGKSIFLVCLKLHSQIVQFLHRLYRVDKDEVGEVVELVRGEGALNMCFGDVLMDIPVQFYLLHSPCFRCCLKNNMANCSIGVHERMISGIAENASVQFLLNLEEVSECMKKVMNSFFFSDREGGLVQLAMWMCFLVANGVLKVKDKATLQECFLAPLEEAELASVTSAADADQTTTLFVTAVQMNPVLVDYLYGNEDLETSFAHTSERHIAGDTPPSGNPQAWLKVGTHEADEEGMAFFTHLFGVLLHFGGNSSSSSPVLCKVLESLLFDQIFEFCLVPCGSWEPIWRPLDIYSHWKTVLLPSIPFNWEDLTSIEFLCPLGRHILHYHEVLRAVRSPSSSSSGSGSGSGMKKKKVLPPTAVISTLGADVPRADGGDPSFFSHLHAYHDWGDDRLRCIWAQFPPFSWKCIERLSTHLTIASASASSSAATLGAATQSGGLLATANGYVSKKAMARLNAQQRAQHQKESRGTKRQYHTTNTKKAAVDKGNKKRCKASAGVKDGFNHNDGDDDAWSCEDESANESDYSTDYDDHDNRPLFARAANDSQEVESAFAAEKSLLLVYAAETPRFTTVYADEVSDFPDSGRHTGEISVSDMLLPPYVPDLNEEILACLSKRERRYRVTDDGGFTLEDRLRDDSDDLWTTRELAIVMEGFLFSFFKRHVEGALPSAILSVRTTSKVAGSRNSRGTKAADSTRPSATAVYSVDPSTSFFDIAWLEIDFSLLSEPMVNAIQMSVKIIRNNKTLRSQVQLCLRQNSTVRQLLAWIVCNKGSRLSSSTISIVNRLTSNIAADAEGGAAAAGAVASVPAGESQRGLAAGAAAYVIQNCSESPLLRRLASARLKQLPQDVVVSIFRELYLRGFLRQRKSPKALELQAEGAARLQEQQRRPKGAFVLSDNFLELFRGGLLAPFYFDILEYKRTTACDSGNHQSHVHSKNSDMEQTRRRATCTGDSRVPQNTYDESAHFALQVSSVCVDYLHSSQSDDGETADANMHDLVAGGEDSSAYSSSSAAAVPLRILALLHVLAAEPCMLSSAVVMVQPKSPVSSSLMAACSHRNVRRFSTSIAGKNTHSTRPQQIPVEEQESVSPSSSQPPPAVVVTAAGAFREGVLPSSASVRPHSGFCQMVLNAVRSEFQITTATLTAAHVSKQMIHAAVHDSSSSSSSSHEEQLVPSLTSTVPWEITNAGDCQQGSAAASANSEPVPVVDEGILNTFSTKLLAILAEKPGLCREAIHTAIFVLSLTQVDILLAKCVKLQMVQRRRHYLHCRNLELVNPFQTLHARRRLGSVNRQKQLHHHQQHQPQDRRIDNATTGSQPYIDTYFLL